MGPKLHRGLFGFIVFFMLAATLAAVAMTPNFTIGGIVGGIGLLIICMWGALYNRLFKVKCPRCGGEMKPGNKFYKCKDCGFHWKVPDSGNANPIGH